MLCYETCLTHLLFESSKYNKSNYIRPQTKFLNSTCMLKIIVLFSIKWKCLCICISLFVLVHYKFSLPGSISHVGDGESVGRAVVSTLVSCAGGGTVVLFVYKMFGGGTWSLARVINGCLTGMVSVAGGCDGYTPWMALIMSIMAGKLYLGISNLLVKLKIDDPVDSVAVHFGSGEKFIIPLIPQLIKRLEWKAYSLVYHFGHVMVAPAI